MFEIVWENQTSEEFLAILEFWNNHNNSNSYLRKLFAEIKKAEELLEKNPEAGSETNFKKIKRLIIQDNFSLFYTISKKDNYIYILSI
ncbi:MAG: type II toxin-antitoxin system RelE/ParE family toxin [Empedobacter falsenii]